MSTRNRLYSAKLSVLCVVLTACGDQGVVARDGAGPDAVVTSAIEAVRNDIPGTAIAVDLGSLDGSSADLVAATFDWARRDRDDVLRCGTNDCALDGADALISVEQTSFDDRTASVALSILGQFGGGGWRQHVCETAYRVDLRWVDGSWETIGRPQVMGHVKWGFSGAVGTYRSGGSNMIPPRPRLLSEGDSTP